MGHAYSGSRWKARAAVGAVLSAMLVLVGCSAEIADVVGNEQKRPSASAQPQDAGDPKLSASCTALTTSEVTQLAGKPMGEPHPWTVAGVPACQWGKPGEVRIQVISVPAEIWAMRLPATLDQVRKSGLFDDPSNRRKLEAASELIGSGEKIDPDKACELFSLLLEIQGRPKGTTRTINLLPTRNDPKAVTGQTCDRGTFTSVLLVAPDVTGSRSEIARVSNALTQAHARGTD